MSWNGREPIDWHDEIAALVVGACVLLGSLVVIALVGVLVANAGWATLLVIPFLLASYLIGRFLRSY